MTSAERFGARTVLLAMALMGASCSKKGPECQRLITSMNELGSKLAETQKVTSNDDARPEQVAAALRPFANAAKVTSETLSGSDMTVPEIRRIASAASAASLALAASSTSMADAADQMKELDAATKTAEAHKKSVDNAEAEIRKICNSNTALCVDLARTLSTFPSPPEKTDDSQLTAAWTGKLHAWAAELAKVNLRDDALKGQVVVFEKSWKDFASVLAVLVRISETAKKYDGFTKSFNAQIDAANKAIGEANSFCKS